MTLPGVSILAWFLTIRGLLLPVLHVWSLATAYAADGTTVMTVMELVAVVVTGLLLMQSKPSPLNPLI